MWIWLRSGLKNKHTGKGKIIMREIKKLLASYRPKIEKVDKTCLHITLPTNSEEIVYQVKDILSDNGYLCMCYQTNCDSPQLGVFFAI